jgi:hypothetical protein
MKTWRRMPSAPPPQVNVTIHEALVRLTLTPTKGDVLSGRLTATEAREVAAALLSAADVIEGKRP